MCGILCECIKYKICINRTKSDGDSDDAVIKRLRTIQELERKECLRRTKLIRHRGPDWSGIYSSFNDEKKMSSTNDVIMMHERLSIVDPHGGSQPLIYNFSRNDVNNIYSKGDKGDFTKNNKLVLCVNGEIYNHKKLRVKYNNYDYKTNSDCEVILALYWNYMKQIVSSNLLDTQPKTLDEYINELDGQFSFVLYDSYNDQLIISRDPIGITSLYIGTNDLKGEDNNYIDRRIMISSEFKSLDCCETTQMFEPGYYMIIKNGIIKTNRPYYSSNDYGKWQLLKGKHIDDISTYLKTIEVNDTDLTLRNNDNENNDEIENIKSKLFDTLLKAVEKRLMSDVPFGLLLSGGLDSSIVCALAKKIALKDPNLVWGKGNKFHTFSIGLEGAPDLLEAQKVADYLETNHTGFTFTIQEGLDAVRDVIWHLETYDITTIRASIPMYLLSRKIKAMGIKMVLSGEGSDELFGGYLYFLSAPSDEEFHLECCKRVSSLGHFDCLRANKTTMAWGVEGRVPFLDRDVIDLAMKIHPTLKYGGSKRIEKWILRETFKKILPDDIVWRQKEQFSDGVGYSWIDSLKEMCENKYTDEKFTELSSKLSINKPATKEALYYRQIYDELYPGKENIVKLWIPKTDWDGVTSDPSGRAQLVHNNTVR